MSEATLAAAFEYAAKGIAVLPIWAPGEEPNTCSCGYPDCTSPAKHPYGQYAPNGANSATTDLATIQDWLSNNSLNIGVAGGNGYAFFDIDNANVRDALLSQKIKAAVVVSGKGCHIWFKVKTGNLPPSTLVYLKDSSYIGEIRCRGQYVVAPPSRHTSGAVYRWASGSARLPPIPETEDLYAQVLDVLKRLGFEATISEPSHYEIPEQHVERIDAVPFDTAYFPFVEQVLFGGYPTADRSKMLRQFALAVVEAAAVMKADLASHEIAGLVRAADEVNGSKFVHRRDADRRYMQYAVEALRGASSVLQMPQPTTGVAFDETAVQGPPPERRGPFEFLTSQQLIDRVAAMPPPTWLAKPIWPSDAYGVVAASDKSGKSFAICDLAISKAAGYAWMGIFECPEPGPVLVFLGEGGERKMLRRFLAICESKGIKEFGALPIKTCYRVPHLIEGAHMAAIEQELKEFPARLVIIDPLYLAARGADQRDLYGMGAHLSPIQEVIQRNQMPGGTALVVVTHFKKAGEDESFKRITGVGPGAWGRVIATATATSVSGEVVKKEGETVVDLEWDFIGDEINDVKKAIRRRIWADDQDDLTSPLHYEVEEIEAAQEVDVKLNKIQTQVSRYLASTTGSATAAQIAQIIDSSPRAVSRALEELEFKGMVAKVGGDRKSGFEWANTMAYEAPDFV